MLDGPIKRTFAYLKDPLRKNAFYLMVTGIVTGVLGFIFWVIVARFYTPTQVGLASAIISAATLLAMLSNLGFGMGLIRFLSGANEKATDMINSCFTTSGIFSIILALIFLGGLDVLSPALLFIRSDVIFIAIFITFTLFFLLSSLQDSLFIASRQAKYILSKNTILGIIKIPLPIFLVAFGAFGIFTSYTVAYMMTVVFSTFFFIPKAQPEYKPIPIIKKSIVNDIFHFSFGNHIAEMLAFAPGLILPLIIMNILNPEMTAYFYIAWMIATILFLIPRAISTSLFAEGSHDELVFQKNIRKSAKFALFLLIPAISIMFLIGNKILLLFGEEYASNAIWMLWLLALSTIPITINSIYITIKRIKKKIEIVILINGFIAFSTIITSYLLLESIGLICIGAAWLTSQAIITGIIIIRSIKGHDTATKSTTIEE